MIGELRVSLSGQMDLLFSTLTGKIGILTTGPTLRTVSM